MTKIAKSARKTDYIFDDSNFFLRKLTGSTYEIFTFTGSDYRAVGRASFALYGEDGYGLQGASYIPVREGKRIRIYAGHGTQGQRIQTRNADRGGRWPAPRPYDAPDLIADFARTIIDDYYIDEYNAWED
ncbi:MAG: hypothetical protein YHS30scaffold324_53 [Catenulispora phage 69_17]|jgi:hypothetical protein|nr:MAG: hypothetical protein YHS30scaffold324_53 [Catenulispora phage 69_17]